MIPPQQAIFLFTNHAHSVSEKDAKYLKTISEKKLQPYSRNFIFCAKKLKT
jgi:hypothetical protein